MIEQEHFRAFRKAGELAHQAITEGRLDDAQKHTKQLTAIFELEKARREIFAKHGVEDLPLQPVQPEPGEASVIARRDKRFEELSQRARNALARHGITNLEQAAALSDNEILTWRNIGIRTLEEIRRIQKEHGLPYPK